MSVAGSYRIRKTLPHPGGGERFVAENIFDFTPEDDGILKGGVDTGDGSLIPFDEGYYNGEFFKIIYPVGPGKWEICGRIIDGRVSGVVSIAGGGSPDLVEGEMI